MNFVLCGLSVTGLKRIGFIAVTFAALLTASRLPAADIVINEIMYHPLQPASGPEPIAEEFIELYNGRGTNVNLNGWKISGGIDFVFSNVTITAHGYLVVAANVQTFLLKYPGVLNVVGNWTGVLNNHGENIQLEDALGHNINSVRYADEGDWSVRQRGPFTAGHQGWIWYKPADGFGYSMELISAEMPNAYGQNWAPSVDPNGTPGAANSRAQANIPPLVLEVNHRPIVPRSTNQVTVAARLLDEQTTGLIVTLWYRESTSSPLGFASTNMLDDGAHGDGIGGDGIFGAVLPARPNGTVVEFYIEAQDADSYSRTYPPPALEADGVTVRGQVANLLYQVDDSNYTGSQPLYKVIMPVPERDELVNQILCSCSGNQSDAEMNTTFVGIDGTGTDLRYQCSARNRGHGSRSSNPHNLRVDFRSDDLFKGIRALNINAQTTHAQHFGSVLALKSGLAGATTRPVQLRINNQNFGVSSGTMYNTTYACNEVLNSDWGDHRFPLDSGGNLYRALRDISPHEFDYRGENQSSYQNTYFKTSNQSQDDWTDLIALHRVMGLSGTTPFTTANVRQVVNVEQWMLHLAFMCLIGNNETGLNTGYNDDYFMYRGINDPRFMLLFYDLDQVMGQGGSLGTGSGLFTCTQNLGAGNMLNRFIHWPDFEPIYYQTLQRLLDTTFSKAQFDPLVEQTLNDYAPSAATAMKTWMDGRRSFVQSQLSGLASAIIPPVATIFGEPRSPTPKTTANLTVGGANVVSYMYKLNNGAWSAETALGTPISLSGLANNSTNTVFVVGKNSSGIWQSTNAPTVSKVWVVKTSWPSVRLSEVLARNVSAYNHEGTFPDAIELYHEGPGLADISGWRLTDDPNAPDKFTFPPETKLASGNYLVVYANDPDGTSGFHLGFSLQQEGDGIYLFNSIANGGALLDSVAFGQQLTDLSIGRQAGPALNDSGGWLLCQPSFGGANVAQATASQYSIKINEWLAASGPSSPQDFVELYNTASLPADLSGLYLTDNAIGTPTLHAIPPLTFMPALGFLVFIADGDTDAGPDHLNFRLASEQGEIGLVSVPFVSAVPFPIDCVNYGAQRLDVSTGRCPDGGTKITPLSIPTPGGPNACPPTGQPPISVVGYTNFWKYDQTANYDGVPWIATNYDDSAWPSGRGVLARLNNSSISQPTNTVLNIGRMTYYFRTTFVAPTNGNIFGFQISHFFDDGAVVYLNGQEAYRNNMPGGTPTYSTPGNNISGAPPELGPFPFPSTNMYVGTNVLAVEVHQNMISSLDVVMGLKLEAALVTNSIPTGVMINEVLANNNSFEEPDGSAPDWVELYNATGSAIDLSDMSFSDSTSNPRRWVFPTNSFIGAGSYLKIRFDGSAPASTSFSLSMNTGFGLKASADKLYLFNKLVGGGTVFDSISFGIQVRDLSIGRFPPGATNWVLTLPTPEAANLSVTLADPSGLRINEWMASPASGDDWFEVYNSSPQPVALGGLYTSDDLGQYNRSPIPPLSFIGANTNGYQKFAADSNVAAGADHADFKLAGSSGEAIGIFTASGNLIDGITFGPQDSGISEGRLPDGSANIIRFPGTESPGEANYIPLTDVVISEALTHTDPPLEDAIELHNTTGGDINIGGWFLSDAKSDLQKFFIPPNTMIPANGYYVLYEYQFNDPSGAAPFALSSVNGDEIYLSPAGPNGLLTGLRDSVKFGAAENGVSFGRFETSVGVDFPAMSDLSFGTSVRAGDPPNLISLFRTGPGAANPYPKIGPVVISEIMYHPPDISTNDNIRDEFIELYNVADHTVPLYDPNCPTNTWRLRDAVDFNFPAGLSIAAGGYLVIVSFDPSTNGASLTDFRAQYGTNAILLGPYSGKLDNSSDKVELYKPDPPQSDGEVPYVLVERVHYADNGAWPTNADGAGASLQRLNVLAYGNEPLNWVAAAPTAGKPLDRDQDGMPDWWEITYGLDPLSNDANVDSDLDGPTNIQEYMAGTNPSDANSVLRLTVSSPSANTVVLRLNAVAGKTYKILWRETVPGNDWNVLTTISETTTHEVTYPDSASVGQRFYRLKIEP